MRERDLIEGDGKRVEILQLEVLLDIRDLLKAQIAPKTKTSKTKKEN